MDITKDIWNWGLGEARVLQFNMLTEPAWDADDSAAFLNYRSFISEVASDLAVGSDEAHDLKYALYGDDVLCYCGCGEYFPQAGGDYDRWDFDHNRNHLSWLYG